MTAFSGLLKTIPLLSTLPPHHIDAVARICTRHVFNAGEEIVRAGTPAEATYYLIDGNIDCLTERDGETVAVPVPSGATLLELAMIVELDVNATCVARHPAKVLRIPRNAMHDLMQDDIALTDAMIETLTLRLKSMADTMREAAEPFQEARLRA